MFTRGPLVANVLIGIGLDLRFSTIANRMAPKWRAIACEQSVAAGLIGEAIATARRLVVIALTPKDTEYVMGLADRHPNQIDGVILLGEADQAGRVDDWRRGTKFNGLCKFSLDGTEYMARSLSTMLANIDAYSVRGISPGRIVQLR